MTTANVLEVSTDYLLLDISVNSEKKLSALFNSLRDIKADKFEKLYSVIKILADNIDEL